jgi:hypothetical protein
VRLAWTAVLFAGVSAARADVALPARDPAAALVEKWRVAQNRGDFDAYRALYAAGFVGVRRSGARTVSFDRDGWLRDRARMFKKPMRVDVAELKTARTPTGWQASFIQTFQSGDWRDRGEKRLALVDESGELRIAREELVASERLPPGGAPAPTKPKGIVFLRSGCYGWSAREHSAICVVGRRITNEPADMSLELLDGAAVKLPVCPDDSWKAAGLGCGLDEETTLRVQRLWVDAGARELPDGKPINDGDEVEVKPGVQLRLWQRQVTPGGYNRAARMHNRMELRCKRHRDALFEDVDVASGGVDGHWQLVEGRWLVVDYRNAILDEGQHDEFWEAKVVDLDDECR